MGTLRTTINLNSTDSLPISLNETGSNTISTGNFVESGKITIKSWDQNFFSSKEGILTNSNCGPNGAYLYVKSLSTNKNKVKLYGYQQITEEIDEMTNEGIESFATLNPGDSMLVPITPQQSTILAATNFGEAVIDYYIVDRVGEFGESALAINAGDKYRYVVFDAQLAEVLPSGTPTAYWEGKDLGLPTSGWTLNDISIVNNKGYIIKFYDNLDNTHKIFKFIGSRGDVIGTWEYTGSFDYKQMENEGYLIIYNDGGSTYITFFDGDNLYQHEIVSTGFYFPDDWDQLSKDKSFVVEIYDYLGNVDDVATIMVNKDRIHTLEVLNTSTNLSVYDRPTYVFGNFVLITIMDVSINRYHKFKIYNTNGILLKEYTLSDHYDIQYLDYLFYGTNKLLFIFTDSSDIDYIFTYNGISNTLSGIDLNTNLLNEIHPYDITYKNRNIYAYSRYPNNPPWSGIEFYANFDKESVVIIYSDNANNHSTRHINSEVGWCDILYMLGGESTFTTYKFNENGVFGTISTFSSDAIGKNGSGGFYSNRLALGGSGGNATFDITVDQSNLVSDIQINNVGSLYLVGNTLTIPGDEFGGSNGIGDITITVESIFNVGVKFIRIPYPWYQDYNIYPSSNLITISYGVSGYKTGPLNVMTITSSGIDTFQLAAEMDKSIGGISSWSESVIIEPVGDYVMYSTRIENISASTTTYTMVKSSTLKDSFTSSGDARNNYYLRYNSLYIYGDMTPKTWYFNKGNNKFTEVSDGWTLYDGIEYNYVTVNGMYDGNILLVPTTLDVKNPVTRLIKNGLLSDTLTLPQTDGNWGITLSSEGIILNYQDMENDYKYVVNVYDLNLNLIRTVPLLISNFTYGQVIGKRSFYNTFNADPKGEVNLNSYYMITNNGVAYLALESTLSYTFNDSFWFNF